MKRFKIHGVVAGALVGVMCSGTAWGLSNFDIDVDGQFAPDTEWSDVTPLAFISPDTPDGTLFGTTINDPNANSFTYADIAVGIGGGGEEAEDLYLMYSEHNRTNQNFFPGEFIADIFFPIDATAVGGTENNFITVQIRAAQEANLVAELNAGMPIDVFVEIDGVGNFLADELPGNFGIEAAVGFGNAPAGFDEPQTALPHLLVELEVALKIDAGFFVPDGNGPLPEGGVGGVYSPDPAFWGGDFGNDLGGGPGEGVIVNGQINGGGPPGSAALFTILPDGTVVVTSLAQQVVPEPLTAALGLIGLAALGAATRRRA